MTGLLRPYGFLLTCAGLLTVLWPGEIRCDVGANALLSARCEVICLTEFNDRTTHVSRNETQASKRGTSFLEECLKDRICSACVRPCNYTTISTRLSTCHTYCQAGEDLCAESCVFLKRAHTKKPGSCRAPEKATGFASACIRSCSQDGDCADHLKCCSNGADCGFTCQPPDKLSEDIPKVPQLTDTTEKRNGKAFVVSWHSKETNNDSLVVYVLQFRHVLAVKPKWSLNTPWKLITQTTRRNYLVRDIQAGHWYQFRVAAVAANGTNGFSEPSPPFRSFREVRAPSQPRNLSEAGFSVQDKKIHLNVSWLPPLESDLPIIKYKVYWSQRLSQITAQMVSLYVYKVNVPGNQTWTVIKDLNSDTTYFIQVEAIARKGDYRMKSLRVSELMNTYEIPLPDTQEPPTSALGVGHNLPNLITVFNISAEAPFYQNTDVKCLVTWEVEEDEMIDIVKFMITWKPMTCGFRGDERMLADVQPTGATSHSSAFYTYGLQFGCHYLVRIRTVNTRTTQGPITEKTFFVPQCADILVKGRLQPECPTLAEPEPPLRPRQLQHSVYVAGKNISVVIKWKRPHSDAPIEFVKVTWGIIGQGSSQSDHTHSRKKDLSEMEKSSLKSVQLPGDGHRAVLETLMPDAVYAAEVVAVSSVGESPAARLEFSTPSLPPTDQHDVSQFGNSADEPRPNEETPVVDSRAQRRKITEKSSSSTVASKPSTSSTITHHSLADFTLLICIIVAVLC